MSFHHLPEDLAKWPTNPYEILGVPAGSDERALKRAYSKLIRHFKPEHHPEKFQKIREAYESAKRWRMPWGEPDEEPSFTDTVIFRPPLSEAHDFSEDSYPAAEWEGSWEKIRRGELEAGYAALQKAAEREPGGEDLCLRLFWILKVRPELDERPAVFWLAGGMRKNGLRGRMFQLYLQELEHNPRLALDASTEDLLELSESADRLAQLLTARVRAACQLGKMPKAEEELDKLRNLIIAESPAAWIRVLSRVLDEVAWLEWPSAPAFYAKLANELATFEDMHIGLDDIFDRFELLNELRKGIIQIPKAERRKGLARLAIRSWNADDDVNRRGEFYKEFAEWSRSPGEALKTLDQTYLKAPQVVGQLSEATRMLSTSAGRAGDPAASGRPIRNVLRHWVGEPYKSIRTDIAAFCIEEWVTPAEIVRTIVEEAKLRSAEFPPFSELANHIHEDLPLKVLVDGIRACDRTSWS